MGGFSESNDPFHSELMDPPEPCEGHLRIAPRLFLVPKGLQLSKNARI